MTRILSLALALAGCTGIVDEPPTTDARPPDMPPDREPGVCVDESVTGHRDLARLTKHEYQATLATILHEDVFDMLVGAIAQVPDDGVDGRFDRLWQELGASHVRGYAAVAEAAAAVYENDAAHRARIVGCDLATGGCLESFIATLGATVYRRPLDASEVESYAELYALGSSEGEGVGLVVSRLLQSPDFVFRVEVRGEDAGPARIHLTDRELANRIAYDLWGLPPDDTLLSSVESGALATDAGLASEVDRMLADPRGHTAFMHFARQWLGLDREYDLENLTDAIRMDTETTRLNTASKEELERLVEFLVFEQHATYRDLMTTPVSFVYEESLASIYGVAPGTPDDPLVMLDDPRRHGLLTRVGMLAADNGEANLIMRGKQIRVDLLCGTLLPPPSDLPPDATEAPPLDPTLTTRQRYEIKTAGAECQGCHIQINPIGFALEDYDGVGRFRTEETVYDEAGEPAGTLPIDASVDPLLAGMGEVVNGGAELSRSIGESEAGAACAATQWIEYQTRRLRVAEDACLVDQLGARLNEPGGFYELVRSYVLHPDYRFRRIEEE